MGTTAGIAVTGATGQLGSCLVRLLGASALPLPRADLDITDAAAVRAAIERLRPRAVINCAAWTAVDRAEAEPVACRAANETAVLALADAARATGALLVQVSTDYVFEIGRAHV